MANLQFDRPTVRETAATPAASATSSRTAFAAELLPSAADVAPLVQAFADRKAKQTNADINAAVNTVVTDAIGQEAQATEEFTGISLESTAMYNKAKATNEDINASSLGATGIGVYAAREQARMIAANPRFAREIRAAFTDTIASYQAPIQEIEEAADLYRKLNYFDNDALISTAKEFGISTAGKPISQIQAELIEFVQVAEAVKKAERATAANESQAYALYTTDPEFLKKKTTVVAQNVHAIVVKARENLAQGATMEEVRFSVQTESAALLGSLAQSAPGKVKDLDSYKALTSYVTNTLDSENIQELLLGTRELDLDFSKFVIRLGEEHPFLATLLGKSGGMALQALAPYLQGKVEKAVLDVGVLGNNQASPENKNQFRFLAEIAQSENKTPESNNLVKNNTESMLSKWQPTKVPTTKEGRADWIKTNDNMVDFAPKGLPVLEEHEDGVAAKAEYVEKMTDLGIYYANKIKENLGDDKITISSSGMSVSNNKQLQSALINRLNKLLKARALYTGDTFNRQHIEDFYINAVTTEEPEEVEEVSDTEPVVSFTYNPTNKTFV